MPKPEHEPIIEAPIVRQSTLTNKNGDIVAQWNIRVPEKTREAMNSLIAGIKSSIEALPPRELLNEDRSADLANEFVFSDVHIGQMCNVDTQQSLQEQFNIISDAFGHMVATAPKAETAVIVVLGDWFHFDNLLPLTPRSGNVLFSNGNYRDLVEIGVKLLRKLVDWCLMTHDKVELVVCEGNHDQASALWLKIMMMALYAQEQRIKVADSETPFYAISHGGCFLGYHHGHIKGLRDTKDLALYFAAEFRKLWGDTEHTYLKTGHLHHVHEKEEHGVLIQQYPTLAGKDHNSHTHGYRGPEATSCTTYHALFGEVGTTRVTKEMLLR